MNETTNKKGSGKLIMMTSFLSGITGAFVAYMTPKTGEVVREKILKVVESLKKSENAPSLAKGAMLLSGEVLNSLNQKAARLLEHGIKLIDDSQELLTAAYLAGKEVYERGEETALLEKTEEENVEHEQPESKVEPPIGLKEQQAQESEKEEVTPKEEDPFTQKDENETSTQQEKVQEDEKEKNSD